MSTPTYNEALAAQAQRRREDEADAMWASRDRTPAFASPEAVPSWRSAAWRVSLALVIVAGLLFAFWPSAKATPSDSPSDSGTVEVWWLMPDGGTPDNVTWPQTHSPGGAVECGVWYQVDTYTLADAERFTADGVLHNGEDSGAALSWRFVYGGDCEVIPPQPPNEVQTQYRDHVVCEDATVVVEEFERQAGYYLGDDGQWHLGEFGDWSKVAEFERELNASEVEACTPVDPEPTEPPVTEPPTEEPTDPEPTTPVDPEPTVDPTPDPTETPTTTEPSAPVEPSEPSTPPTDPTVAPTTATPAASSPGITPATSEVRAEQLPETGAPHWQGAAVMGLVLMALGVVASLYVRRIGGQR